MCISTENTWHIQDIIQGVHKKYFVAISIVEGVHIRCLRTVESNIPIALIYHIKNQGDWILFDDSILEKDWLGIPRVMNGMNMDAEEMANKILYQIRSV